MKTNKRTRSESVTFAISQDHRQMLLPSARPQKTQNVSTQDVCIRLVSDLLGRYSSCLHPPNNNTEQITARVPRKLFSITCSKAWIDETLKQRFNTSISFSRSRHVHFIVLFSTVSIVSFRFSDINHCLHFTADVRPCKWQSNKSKPIGKKSVFCNMHALKCNISTTSGTNLTVT